MRKTICLLYTVAVMLSAIGCGDTFYDVYNEFTGPVQKVEVRPELSIVVSESEQLHAVVYPSMTPNKKVSWSSSNPGNVSVDPDTGIVTGLVVDQTSVITVTTDDGGLSAECLVTVVPVPKAIETITLPLSLSLELGMEYTFVPVILPEDATSLELTWSSSNNSVVTVTSGGVIHGVNTGSAIITALSTRWGKSASCFVTVENADVIYPSTIVFNDGEDVTKQLGSGIYTNAVSGDGDGAITYSSGTPAVATVNADTGEVTILSLGITIITAVKEATATHETVTNTYTLTVTDLTPSTIVFGDASKSIALNGGPYTNTVTGEGTGAITYTSGTPGTATINAMTGEVTLVAAGTTVITAVKAAKDTYTSATNSYTLTVTGAITYSVGQTGPSGTGIVFYITDGGLHGLEAAPKLWNGGTADPLRQWKTVASDTAGTQTAIGTGYANTYLYMTGNGHPAARICREYRGGNRSDWFLPSSLEIIQLRTALGSNDTDRTTYGFTNVYWTSSQVTAADGYYYAFVSGGAAAPTIKTGSYSVRPIRAF